MDGMDRNQWTEWIGISGRNQTEWVDGMARNTQRVGAGQVLSLLYTYFTLHRMIISGGGIGYGREKGEVRQGPGGAPFLSALEEARAVGKNMVKMVKSQG